MVRVEVADAPACGLTELGENAQVVSDGNPLQESVVAAANPSRLPSVTVMVVDCPGVTVALAGEVAIEKSADAGGGVAFAVNVANRPCISSVSPDVKYRVFGSPVPPAPNTISHSDKFTMA